MTDLERIQAFLAYAARLAGDEKGEAQVFCDRLFIGFGHEGYKEAGATLEYRIKNVRGSTSYADLLWPPAPVVRNEEAGREAPTALPTGV